MKPACLTQRERPEEKHKPKREDTQEEKKRKLSGKEIIISQFLVILFGDEI